MAWKRGIKSLNARVSIWPICGRPLAVGGPSKNVKRSFPSLTLKDLRMMSSRFQNSETFFSRLTKSMSVETF